MSLVRFNANGEAVFIYEDGHPLLGLGRSVIKRASHVEPDEDGMWVADMAPMGGGLLSSQAIRARALRLEIIWLESHILDMSAYS